MRDIRSRDFFEKKKKISRSSQKSLRKNVSVPTNGEEGFFRGEVFIGGRGIRDGPSGGLKPVERDWWLKFEELRGHMARVVAQGSSTASENLADAQLPDRGQFVSPDFGGSVNNLLKALGDLQTGGPAANKIVAFRRAGFEEALKALPPHLRPPEQA